MQKMQLQANLLTVMPAAQHSNMMLGMHIITIWKTTLHQTQLGFCRLLEFLQTTTTTTKKKYHKQLIFFCFLKFRVQILGRFSRGPFVVHLLLRITVKVILQDKRCIILAVLLNICKYFDAIVKSKDTKKTSEKQI